MTYTLSNVVSLAPFQTLCGLTERRVLLGLFLSKWLEAVHDPSADLAQTEDERRVDALVTQTLAEVDLELVKLEKPKSAQVMYAWALMLKHLEVWGIISVIGSSFQCYADTISRGSESVSR